MDTALVTLSTLSGPVLLLIAMLLDAVFPDLPGLPRAGGVAGGLARAFAVRLDRRARSETARMFRGLAVLVLIAGFAGAGAWVLQDAVLQDAVRHMALLSPLLLAALIWLLGLRRTWTETRRAARAVLQQPGDRSHDTCREAIETCARGLLDGVAGPIFWYLLAGLPGAVMFAATAGISRSLGGKTQSDGAFGLAARRLYAFLGWLPGWIAALLIALAAVFTPQAHPGTAMRLFARQALNPAGLRPLSAMAGALDLTLLGPAPGAPKRGWVGSGRAKATARDVTRAGFVHAVACVLALTTVAALAQSAFASA